MSDKTLQKMIAKMKTLSIERLKEVLHYDPLTGYFTWKIATSFRVRVGQIAGFVDNGYILIGIDGVRYQAHLLAWMYMTGTHPEHFVDHESGSRSDNRWKHLRAATRSENNRNSGVRSHSALGLKGVQRHRTGRFVAKIQFNGKQKYLGIFDTAELAAQAFKDAAALEYGEFAKK